MSLLLVNILQNFFQRRTKQWNCLFFGISQKHGKGWMHFPNGDVYRFVLFPLLVVLAEFAVTVHADDDHISGHFVQSKKKIRLQSF